MTKTKKKTVKFVCDYVVQDERQGTPGEESYTKGKRVMLEPASAHHFVSRGLAVYIGREIKA